MSVPDEQEQRDMESLGFDDTDDTHLSELMRPKPLPKALPRGAIRRAGSSISVNTDDPDPHQSEDAEAAASMTS